MAEKVPAEQLKLGHAVSDVHAQEIKTEDGKIWQGRAVVLATDFESADRLLKKRFKTNEMEYCRLLLLQFSRNGTSD